MSDSRIIVINAPTGELGVDFKNIEATDTAEARIVVSKLNEDSLLLGQIEVGDQILSLDGFDARGKSLENIHQYIEEQGLICKTKTIVVSRATVTVVAAELPKQSKEVAQLDAAVLAATATATATSSAAAATAAVGGGGNEVAGGTGTDGDIEAGGEKVLDTTSEENGKKEDPSSTDTNEPWWKSKRKRCMIGSIAGILLLLIIVVVAVVVSTKGNGGGGVSSGEKATPASDNNEEEVQGAGSEEAVITFKVVGSVIDYTTFPYEDIFDTSAGIPDYLNAQELTQNVNGNGAVSDFVQGFTSVSNEILEVINTIDSVMEILESIRDEDSPTRKLQTKLISTDDVNPVVTDIGCPEGLEYAPPSAFCVQFTVAMKSPASKFSPMMNSAIKNGGLYDAIISLNQDTVIKGMGSPGKGVSYDSSDGVPAPEPVLAPTAPSSDEPTPQQTTYLPTMAVATVTVSTLPPNTPRPTRFPTPPPSTPRPTPFPTTRRPTNPSISICSFCPSGVTFPEYAAASLAGEPVTCDQLKGSSLGTYEGSAYCDNLLEFEYKCCPAGVSGPVCSFCTSGVVFPDFAPASIEGTPVTCQELKDTSLGYAVEEEMCTSIVSFEDRCCPSSSSISSTPPPTPPPMSSVTVCSFCSEGVVFPDATPAAVDGEPISCEALKGMSLGVSSSSNACQSLQPFEDDCCPAGVSPSSPSCSFCSSGVLWPSLVAATTNGGDAVSCQEMDALAQTNFEGTDQCGIYQSYEFMCCPSGEDRCQFCEDGLKKPNLDITNLFLFHVLVTLTGTDWYLHTHLPGSPGSDVTCQDFAIFLRTLDETNEACAKRDVFEDVCC